MDIQTAKQIGIAEYLHSLGYSPVRRQGGNLWYKSPLREETEASFKVNTERNLWYDFATGKGGNIIALAAELYASDHVPYLLEMIARQAPHVRPVSFSFGGQTLSQPSFRQLEVMPLSSPALFSYLRERGINTELAKRECREVHYLRGCLKIELRWPLLFYFKLKSFGFFSKKEAYKLTFSIQTVFYWYKPPKRLFLQDYVQWPAGRTQFQPS